MAVEKSKLQNIVGVGFKFPFSFSKRTGGVSKFGDDGDHTSFDKVRMSLAQILGTSFSERFIRRNFGNFLYSLLAEGIDGYLEARLRQFVTDSILRYERRIALTNLQVNKFPDEGKIELVISFVLARTKQEGNLVYPLYLKDGQFFSVNEILSGV